ncbi:hypothetical protein A3A09_03690 [Candidatus Nomurabacteria bacterium RIFCSPLOWO2_01_FULL_42_20]|uniref:ATP-grasp domain-containing protein n=1 Tax=Candidatus Nomurabacteria bacterium RIFCSPHIGHO2_01_FULL_42_16 TaxID=1801743 RepID=A0A1F6VID9_9BACT|nr:MAG: hypothetical protein A2824_00855 [Candidatus Nomurabacteria bacterium RIFCSPHIGHO2_01_FULL_42_16]OGI91409.1 MAG: hypothetical protein A3A09_03690 [Candidatus Nomurabacteria bacterium RIFCSPLOWO2_01_FULL_42_20]
MKLKVGVLRGGVGPEYDISLKTGGAVLANLDREKYRPVDILIDKEGIWHADGIPLKSKENLKSIVDVVWNGMHGYLGEDGRIQNFLEGAGVPFTGPRSLPAYVSLNKSLAKNKFSKLGLRSPFGEMVGDEIEFWNYGGDSERYVEDKAREIFQKISPPWIVKPLLGTCSIDVYLAENFAELVAALTKVLQNHESALVEEFVRGREIVVGIIENFRDKENYTLIPLEIIKSKPVFDYETRHGGDYRLLRPADLTLDEKVLIGEAAAKIHEHFDLGQYSLVDLILTKNGVRVLEVDSLPDLGEHSLFCRSLAEVGAGVPEFLECVINKTLEK